MSYWGGFDDRYRCSFLDPMDPLFAVIQREFLTEQTRLFGTGHIYGADPFNEIDAPTWDPETLAGMSRHIYESMAEVDPEAVWLQMGWLFYADPTHWTAENIRAFLGAVPQDRLLMLDYFCEFTEIWKQTEKFHRPVICIVDTLGAYCGAEAEERGQGEAIAENILEMMGLRTPVISVVIGEGGSGGALALAAADRVYMLENAVYSVISPEGCASILWKDSGRVADAAQCLHITAADMVDLHVAEEIIPENFADFPQMCAAMTVQLTMDLDELCALSPEELLEQRYRRYRRIGVYEENGSIVRFTEH